MEFNYKQFKHKAFQFLSIVEMLHPNTRLRFWVESGVNVLCGWTQVSLMLYLPSETSFVNLTSGIRADG